MSAFRLPYSIAGQWVTGTTIVGLLILTSGCPSVSDITDGSKYGVIVNTNLNKDLIGGVRLPNGQSVYAFGSFNENGEVGEITSAVFEDGNGKKFSLSFESGRPVRAVAPDGSRLEITYREVSETWLRGDLAFRPASGELYTMPFDIDLQKTAAEVASLVEQLTGIQITTDPPPPSSKDRGAARAASRSQRPSVEIIVVPVVLAVTGFTITTVLGQALEDFARTADAIAEAAILTFLAPFIIMGNVMRLALGQPLVTIDYDRDGAILNIPRPEDA